MENPASIKRVGKDLSATGLYNKADPIVKADRELSLFTDYVRAILPIVSTIKPM